MVVGSGAGGATAARELAKSGLEVLILEAGKSFKPFTRHLGWAVPLRQIGLLGGEQTINRIFSHIQTLHSSDNLILIRGVTTGGSTAISCGNMVRAEQGLREIGLDLSSEFEELEALLGVTLVPKGRWRPATQRMFETAERIGLNPHPTPKAVNIKRCISCGLCELGCATGAKWDARDFLTDFVTRGGTILTASPVQRLLIDGERVRGVEVACGLSNLRIEADVVVLAAGGIGTAQILKASGLPARDNLWADITLTMGGVAKDSHQLKEPPMVWYAKQDRYILSPYPDIFSQWFHKPWRNVSINNRVGLMVELADTPEGSVAKDGTVRKALTDIDLERIQEGTALAKTIMEASGFSGPFVEGMLNGGHLGGTVPLTREDVPSMHPSWLPENLWVADLSLVPRSQGLPTILTTAAIALRVARTIARSS